MSATKWILTLRVPLALRKHGGRKQLLITHDAGTVALYAGVDATPVKAVPRSFCWRRMLDEGSHGPVSLGLGSPLQAAILQALFADRRLTEPGIHNGLCAADGLSSASGSGRAVDGKRSLS